MGHSTGCVSKGDLGKLASEFPGLTAENSNLWYICMYVCI